MISVLPGCDSLKNEFTFLHGPERSSMNSHGGLPTVNTACNRDLNLM